MMIQHMKKQAKFRFTHLQNVTCAVEDYKFTRNGPVLMCAFKVS